jgi:hypothetical protein
MEKKNFIVACTVSVSMLLIFASVASIGVQMVAGHERRLYTIGGQDILLVVGSMNEPAYVDDKSGVEAFAYLPDPSDPMNSQANGTKPIEGLVLKTDVSAGGKNMTLDLEPAFRDPGHYEAVFYPTIPTTYSYTVYGDINGTAFRDTFECAPAGESEPAQDNSTVTVSDDFTRKGKSGGFGCFESRDSISFPEKYVSNFELQQMINGSGGGSSNSSSM